MSELCIFRPNGTSASLSSDISLKVVNYSSILNSAVRFALAPLEAELRAFKVRLLKVGWLEGDQCAPLLI